MRALCSPATSPRRSARSSTSAATGTQSLAEVAELVTRLAGSGRSRVVPFPDDRLAIDIGDYYADDTKIRGAARLAARWSALEEGLAATLDFYRAHGEAYWGGA